MLTKSLISNAHQIKVGGGIQTNSVAEHFDPMFKNHPWKH